MTAANGLATMAAAMKNVRNYYRWVYSALAPLLGQRVLEIGPGYGVVADMMLTYGKKYFAIDSDTGVIEYLNKRFPQNSMDFFCGNIDDPHWQDQIKSRQVDTVFSMNVLEHLEDDAHHLRQLAKCVAGGRIVIMVPALRSLYGSLDRQAGHFRRYDKQDLVAVLNKASLTPSSIRYFNGVGVAAWWTASKFFKFRIDGKETDTSIRFNDKLVVPISRLIDPVLSPFFGQSLIAAVSIPIKP
jgi:SAM-dependent methyltransferase